MFEGFATIRFSFLIDKNSAFLPFIIHTYFIFVFILLTTFPKMKFLYCFRNFTFVTIFQFTYFVKKDCLNSIYMFFNRRLWPYVWVSDEVLPFDIDFEEVVVAWSTCGFLLFAPTARPITGVNVFTAGFRNLFHAVWVPLQNWAIWYLKPLPSIMNCLAENVNCFWHWHLRVRHISNSLRLLPLLLKPHHAWLDMGKELKVLHLAVSSIFLSFSEFILFLDLLS